MPAEPGRRRRKPAAQDVKATLYCSFCGKSQHEIKKLIAGPTVFICDECTELCEDILWEGVSDRIMIKVRVPVASEFDEMLYDAMSTLLRERFPDLDFKYECKTTAASEIGNKTTTNAVFSALKIYGSDFGADSGQSYEQIKKKYEQLREEIGSVLAQLSVANQRFVHENRRSERIQQELAQLKAEYLDHLRETSKRMVQSQTDLKVVMFLDVSGFSLLDRSGRERLLDMLRSMIPTLLTGTDASEVNMGGMRLSLPLATQTMQLKVQYGSYAT